MILDVLIKWQDMIINPIKSEPYIAHYTIIIFIKNSFPEFWRKLRIWFYPFFFFSSRLLGGILRIANDSVINMPEFQYLLFKPREAYHNILFRGYNLRETKKHRETFPYSYWINLRLISRIMNNNYIWFTTLY